MRKRTQSKQLVRRKPRREVASERATETAFFHNKAHLLLLILLFAAGFGLRAFHISSPVLGSFHSTRQYRSAIIARALYYEGCDDVSARKKEVAALNKAAMGELEPPILEHLVSVGYHLVGSEQIWVARLLSSIFWLVGGGFLYALTKKLLSPDAALLSTAYYLFLPYAMVASRSFQPDPLMMMMMLVSLYGILQHHGKPSIGRLGIAACATAFAVLIKPVCVFPIMGVFLSLSIRRLGLRKVLLSPSVCVFTFIALLPSAGFYLSGIFKGGFLGSQAAQSFVPELLTREYYWFGWITMVDRVFGTTAIIGAALGAIMVPSGPARPLIVGLWIGYFFYGLVFNYHIHSHDYYQLPLVPIVAISLSSLGCRVLDSWKKGNARWFRQAALVSALILVVYLGFSPPMRPAKRWIAYPQFSKGALSPGYGEIGKLVGHSSHAVFLSVAGYGKPLQYHAELAGTWWPSRAHMARQYQRGVPVPHPVQRLEKIIRGRGAEYFVVTSMEEFRSQQELFRLLHSTYPVLAETEKYVVFDLRRRVNQ